MFPRDSSVFFRDPRRRATHKGWRHQVEPKGLQRRPFPGYGEQDTRSRRAPSRRRSILRAATVQMVAHAVDDDGGGGGDRPDLGDGPPAAAPSVSCSGPGGSATGPRRSTRSQHHRGGTLVPDDQALDPRGERGDYARKLFRRRPQGGPARADDVARPVGVPAPEDAGAVRWEPALVSAPLATDGRWRLLSKAATVPSAALPPGEHKRRRRGERRGRRPRTAQSPRLLSRPGRKEDRGVRGPTDDPLAERAPRAFGRVPASSSATPCRKLREVRNLKGRGAKSWGGGTALHDYPGSLMPRPCKLIIPLVVSVLINQMRSIA
ncbi:hypothetical protein THAOC_32761 [Thalassiosira oceanica]|uniref:Uncharacterized protein n=1 Tax=Thalassiosira oceanica TaxID=159749 RepID=K0R6G5_THAOC|nr:hypothetical protein THAOC_32761 [Thalassiosira oceanica]|eukprot:EJK48440.1 hypothetical protein THAOC_32761 [Thalassiosira oceanica]